MIDGAGWLRHWDATEPKADRMICNITYMVFHDATKVSPGVREIVSEPWAGFDLCFDFNWKP